MRIVIGFIKSRKNLKGVSTKDNSKTKIKLTTKKKTFYFLLMIALTAIIALFTLEIVARLFFPQQEAMRWFLSDEKYGYVLKKNFHQKYHYAGSDFVMEVKTNSNAFNRNRKFV